MTGRVVRDRSHREYPSRFNQKSSHGWKNPPSRHLWVGNLSHNISESSLTGHFLNFGELESVAFQPGRSYAFINFNIEEDAFVAMRELQGFVVAGNPLKIEFTKADKSLIPSHDEDHLKKRDEPRTTARASPFSQRDSRIRHYSPDQSYPEKFKISDKTAEPSEVLWIGFPALLKVDELILRKAFSPFGEIEKITAFPGRTYAFVRFKNVMSACRAREALKGKLFGNPRVHICFAKNESGTSNSARNTTNAPPSPNFRSYDSAGSLENYHPDRNFGKFSEDSIMKSRSVLNSEYGNPNIMSFSRRGNLWSGENVPFEQRRFQELGSDPGLQVNIDERYSSPTRDRGAQFRDFSPPHVSWPAPSYDDPWDLPEDALLFHGAKKLKANTFPPDNELPEYPFSDSEQPKHVLSRIPDIPRHRSPDKTFDSGPFGHKHIPDRAKSLSQTHGERSDQWNAAYDSYLGGSISIPSNPADWKRSTPESSRSEEWKWEGTIAKGGTPICGARCFPVGKVLDMMLPEFLDCTARTGLDMLAKHYYQAASAWVTFFVPRSDTDMGFYNEFMNYLGEKQRAAVAKLDDRTTLFLVPPSEFSEKVLKVPGKLSISGVVLRLEHSGSSFMSIPLPHEKKDVTIRSFHGDTSYARPISPSVSYSSVHYFPNLRKPGINNISSAGNSSTATSATLLSLSSHAIGNSFESMNENRHEYIPKQISDWSPHEPDNWNHVTRNMASQTSSTNINPIVQGYSSVMPGTVQQTSSSNYAAGISGVPLAGSSNAPLPDIKPTVSSSLSVAALQPEQLAMLASSLFGQQMQSTSVSGGGDVKQIGAINHQSEHLHKLSEKYILPSSDSYSSQLGQAKQQQQQTPSMAVVPQRELQTVVQGTQLQNTVTQEDMDADPQTRLQATLQLAAALLQQIQQGKGT